MLEHSVTERGTAAEIPDPPYQQLRTGAEANALGAVVAVARRDFVEAEHRLGENAALAERFLAVPRRFAGTFGAGLMQELALLPLAEIEDLRGNPGRAVQLRRAADTMRDLLLDPVWSSRQLGLAATPDDLAAFTATIRDPHVPAGLRAEGLASGFLGYCLNPREIIGGVSPLRREAVLHSADSVADIPALRTLAVLAERAWTNDHAPRSAAKASRSVLTRIGFCVNMGRR
jgi:hypothetical protein